MLEILQILLHRFYKLTYHQIKKWWSKHYLLYCLSDTNHSLVTSICKFFAVEFVVALAFFIHNFFFFIDNAKVTTNLVQKSYKLMFQWMWLVVLL